MTAVDHSTDHATDDPSVLDELCRRVIDDPRDLEEAARHHVRIMAPLLPNDRQHQLVVRTLREVRGLGLIDDLLDDPQVDEIMVNASRELWVDRRGGLHHIGQLSAQRIDTIIERILAPLGRRLDRSSPVVDARLPDGSRVSAVAPPVALDGICLCIRRFAVRPITLDDFTSPAVADMVASLIRGRMNIVVAGPTSSGKTTLLNAMAAHVPPGERIVTLEDIAELRLTHDHVVRLEARPPRDDGPPPVPLGDLLRAALRLRPDRLIIGEVRGPEAFDLLQALNTGHDGSLATVHANSPADTLRRLAAMTAQGGLLEWETALELAHSALDVIIHVGRGVDGRRQLLEIAEVSPRGSCRTLRTIARGDSIVADIEPR